MNGSRRELVLQVDSFVLDYIWRHTVATIGESIVFLDDVLVEVQIPRQSSPISITSIYSSVF